MPIENEVANTTPVGGTKHSMSLEVLEKVYGKHRTHHQKGIDVAISKGQVGRDKYDIDGYDGWQYDKDAPTDTDRLTRIQTKRDDLSMSKSSIKTAKLPPERRSE
ncbi:hypothetical protein GR204_34420 [Rhizobium leguminosarum]|uniref:Uncharacterized protein n=1 Tax=Rhizobium leguminosarum TaxID=384 RepID=A0A6P0BGD7_RHILE|nr:hypothetical protein [Rhizobium leguminosarum]NEI38969.1 hypothetical protein [Rhizobium leguminosarum]NEI45699.1 hypothetical protein [Rhizobium leguminosarum]